jgi:peptidoglycan/xylan/chitin deacetylase (PgdA/CDA1 family)
MRIWFISQQQVKSGLAFFLIAIFAAGVVVNWDSIARQFFGVHPGVRLEGRMVEGLLPDEVTDLVKVMASGINREPMNASYFPETGEIIPARVGKMVDVAKTVRQVCLAGTGTDIKIQVDTIPPQLTEDFFKPIYSGNPQSGKVALAINVAWGEEHLDEILKVLDEEKVRATFFFVGSWVKLFPELVRTINLKGHEIANHGLFHGHPLQMGKEEVKKMIADNALLLWSVTGKKSANLFGPPYGEVSPQIVAAAGELGYHTILWSVDSIDWKNPAPDAMLERILTKIEPGGIVLLHPTIATKTALRGLILGLRKKNMEPGTVSAVMK